MCNKKYRKVRDRSQYVRKNRGVPHSIVNLRYKAPQKRHVVLQYGSNYDYHFIIKKLAEELRLEYLGENIEKSITFLEPINKELKQLTKNGMEIYNLFSTDKLRNKTTY